MWYGGDGRVDDGAAPVVGERACMTLGKTLDAIDGAKRLVVGHTPQLGGCNDECDGRIWRGDHTSSIPILFSPCTRITGCGPPPPPPPPPPHYARVLCIVHRSFHQRLNRRCMKYAYTYVYTFS